MKSIIVEWLQEKKESEKTINCNNNDNRSNDNNKKVEGRKR